MKCKTCPTELTYPENPLTATHCPECRKKRKKHKPKHRSTWMRNWQNTSPIGQAYKARHKATIRRSSQNWRDAHPDRIKLKNRLQCLVHRGKIIKPQTCHDCGQEKKVVAWNLQWGPAPNSVTIECWVCWACFWKRKQQ